MSEPRQRVETALASRYRVDRELGRGGMATVWLAHDIRHDRRVAIKVLHPELAAIIGADRFLREIRTTASLQHPHILPLHDSGEADGLLWFVMPFVEGESLRDRLDREKQLPVDEAVRIATEVAGALDYAHRRGVIHRDIKPANILLHDGTALVADFGISLALSAAGGTRLTETGLSLGTPHYMSPEQATGDRELDARSDVYSLGCVVYEMLAGEPPFAGPTAQAVFAKALSEDPRPLRELRKAVPAHVQVTALRALEKLPADRFDSAATFAAALAESGVITPGAVAAGPAGRAVASGGLRRAERLVWAAATAIAIALAVLARTDATPGESDVSTGTEVNRLSIPLPESHPILFTGHLDLVRSALAISRDGRRVVHVGRDGDGHRLFLRDMAGDEPRPMEGTEGAFAPFFSWDGEWVGFFAGNVLKKVRVSGGQPIEIAAVANAMGGTWGPDDTILYGGEVGSQLLRIAADGGEPEEIARIGVGDASFDWPRLLPDGRVLYAGWYQDLWVLDPVTRGKVRLDVDGGDARYVASGHLVYTRGADLFAVPFDADRLERRGPEVSVLSGVRTELYGVAQFDVSESGTLVYAPGGSAAYGRLVQVARDGTAEPLGFDPVRFFGPFQLAPDSRRLAVEEWAATGDIWIYDLERGRTERLTRGGNNGGPVWSPASDRIAFWSDRDGSQQVFVKAANANASAERVEVPFGQAVPTSWSKNGFLSLDVVTEETGWDVVAVSLGEDSTVLDVAATQAVEWGGSFSPDGNWIAYTSSEPERYQVFVQPFPPTGLRRQVSFGQQDAEEPWWSRDGRTLYYRSGSQWLAASVTTTPELEIGSPSVAFEGEFLNLSWRSYDIAPDGQRLLAVTSLEGSEATSLNVVQGWFHELERLAPTGR